MTIHLFGDSYVENEPAENLGVKDHKRWYDLLSEEQGEANINYGLCGQGPAQTMDIFRKIYENNKIKDEDKVVIVLSHPMRIPWKWPISSIKRSAMDQASISIDSATIYATFFSRPDDPNTDDLELDEYQEFALGSLYECMWDELSFMNYYRLTFLKKILKVPTVCFTVYDINMNEKDTIYNTHLYDLDLNDENFYLYDKPLFEHSRDEWDNFDMNEGMLNHFSETNHYTIKNIISNHFYNTNYSTEFTKGHIKGVNNAEARDTKNGFVDFIYE